MPDQFVVPQFLDVEGKIFGPVTVRQFLIVVASGLIGVIYYKLFDFSLFLLLTIPTMIVALVVAFIRINGQPFHYFLINIVQTFKRPHLRVWNKVRTTAELKQHLQKKIDRPVTVSLQKPSLTGSRLRDLTLVVNTGGVFVPDDEVPRV